MTKVAGARYVLALAAAVLLSVAGCGGGSSHAQTESAPRSASAEGTVGSEGATGKAPSSAKAQQPLGGEPSSSTPGSKSTNSGKHGLHVAVPKGSPEPAATPQQRAIATVANIALSSPALQPTTTGVASLPSSYTCDGKDSWPELSWQNVPAGTSELALFLMNVQPVNEKIFFDWALAGLDPSSEGIEAGRLPRGAVVGRNGFGKTGYSICPAPSSGETYFFALYALPKALSPTGGFDPTALREQALQISGNAGLLPVSYSRG